MAVTAFIAESRCGYWGSRVLYGHVCFDVPGRMFRCACLTVLSRYGMQCLELDKDKAEAECLGLNDKQTLP